MITERHRRKSLRCEFAGHDRFRALSKIPLKGIRFGEIAKHRNALVRVMRMLPAFYEITGLRTGLDLNIRYRQRGHIPREGQESAIAQIDVAWGGSSLNAVRMSNAAFSSAPRTRSTIKTFPYLAIPEVAPSRHAREFGKTVCKRYGVRYGGVSKRLSRAR